LVWTIKFDKKAAKEFKNLDKVIQKNIDKFLMRLTKSSNPRHIGHALKGRLQPLWRYRIGDHRLICSIEDKIVTILVLRVSHRRHVYKKEI
jgi:mRNA interferase RelE/StbE